MRVLYQILSVVTLLILLFTIGFASGYNFYKGTIVQEVQYDSIPKIIKVPVEVEKEVPVEIPADIDSAAVARDWYTNREYSLEFEENEVRISAKPIVFQNRLDTISFTVQNLRPTQIINAPKNQISLGAIGGRNITAPGIWYKYQKSELGVAYNLQDQSFLISAKIDIANW